ncbi:low molecular weight protein-tyrosine-phosphatase [Paraglaciecola marina]|uniref:low molecular weight protein-tyrosine-phosphatase n=1 Tax=Paraglaciecola marina TaxID=2500157 RepID=UPI001060405A|nr:low molecular weight protein-tyrosine-phosphatase [Paraglaciecola marina]
MSSNKTSVLFVCLGNICRSPSAEAVFTKMAQNQNLDLVIDSAGTAGYHTGAEPDKRSQAVGLERGYSFKGLKCRKVTPEDFDKFDYILGMDNKNISNLLEICPKGHEDKVGLFLSFADLQEKEVPDPYYGGKKGFEYVLDLIEEGSKGLIRQLQDNQLDCYNTNE